MDALPMKTKYDKVPSRLSFQSIKPNKVTFRGQSMIKCLLKCPSSGQNALQGVLPVDKTQLIALYDSFQAAKMLLSAL